MTNKKKRQRGSRTHGGGSQKNRRGAGNRGGRGAAGRKKHEFHQYGPLGKTGFKRPEKTQLEVREVTLRDIDEDVLLLVEDGLAEETDGGYRVDARDLACNDLCTLDAAALEIAPTATSTGIGKGSPAGASHRSTRPSSASSKTRRGSSGWRR